ncbi:MAG: hypothetical protein RIR05_738 [Bacteroidota bacterium]|jgi:hypothetical protein
MRIITFASFYFALLCPLAVNAQYISNIDAQCAAWNDFKLEYNRLSRGDKDGFRVKLHFTTEKAQADAVAEKARKLFPDDAVYVIYEMPNFSVVFGEFENKMSATGWISENKNLFPTAFIVKSRVNTCRPVKATE